MKMVPKNSKLNPICPIKNHQKNSKISNIIIPTMNSTLSFDQIDSNILYSFIEEYYDEIFQNLFFDEKNFEKKINNNYLIFQKEINEKMRAILVDWIIEVHFRLNMNKKTLFICVFIIDAFLSKKIIERKNLQLLGTAALLLASKQNEIIYPTIKTFLSLSEFAYTEKELKEMEKNIIIELNFDILAPTADEFFEIIAEFFKFSREQKFLGEYFLNISLIDYNLLKYKPSTIAIGCCYIVAKYFELNDLNFIFENIYYKYVSKNEVKNFAKELHIVIKKLSNSSLQAVNNKFGLEQLGN